MILAIFLAAAVIPGTQVSMSCTNTGTIQTEPVRGPGGLTAVLKVSSADDHSKNSHQCNADYRLLVSAPGGASKDVDLLTSDDVYDRSLVLRLSGFSQKGNQVLGMFSEGGKHPFTNVFAYPGSDGKLQLVDLSQQFAPVMSVECSSTLEIAGTTSAGEIVLELNSAQPCGPTRRWVLNLSSGRPRPLPPGAPILSLYGSGAEH